MVIFLFGTVLSNLCQLGSVHKVISVLICDQLETQLCCLCHDHSPNRAPASQNGRFCDSDGNVRPWEFELAFRDLLRRYAQRRLADCASGAAGAQEAEVAKIGALKMLMLNIEHNPVVEARPLSTCEHEVGSSAHPLTDPGIIKSSSRAMLLRDIQSKDSCFDRTSHRIRSENHDEHTAAPIPLMFKAARSREGSGVSRSGGLAASTESVDTELSAIAHTVSQILWEQRATSAAIEEIRSALLSSGALCDGSTKAAGKQARQTCSGSELLCRTHLPHAVNGKRIRMRWRHQHCVEKEQRNVAQAKNNGPCDVSPEQQTSSFQADQSVSSKCTLTMGSSEPTSSFNPAGDATHFFHP